MVAQQAQFGTGIGSGARIWILGEVEARPDSPIPRADGTRTAVKSSCVPVRPPTRIPVSFGLKPSPLQ